MSKAHYRQADLKAVSCSPRASLARSRHSFVDALLKDLRACSRRLKISLETYANEAQVLERLYYKGKNQHRGALFWRRVAEARRYSARLDGIHVDDVVEILRYSFFGEGAHDDPKLTKGSWTHFPDKTSTLFVVERLSATSALVTKMHMRLVDIYRSFTLSMHSGAFLHLVLTLLAVVSRLGSICLEVLEALQGTSNAIRSIQEVLSVPETEWPVHGDRKDHLLAGSISEDTSSRHDDHLPVLPEVTTNDPSTAVGTLPLSRMVVRRTVIKGTSLGRQAPEEEANVRRNKERNKKSSVKDEIDQIFGF